MATIPISHTANERGGALTNRSKSFKRHLLEPTLQITLSPDNFDLLSSIICHLNEMLFIIQSFVFVILIVGEYNVSSNIVRPSKIGFRRYRKVDEIFRDRDFERYIRQLERLKLDEMKKAIRTRVLAEKFHPYFSLKHIARRLELLELYDPDTMEVGYLENSLQKNLIYRTRYGQGILYVKISETDKGDRDHEKTKEKFVRPIIVLVAGIEGRNWMTVHVIMHVITYLVTSYNSKKLLGFDWWIIPVLNPDGYINSIDNKMSRNYSTNINPGNGCWGVNLDRNFLLQRTDCRDRHGKINCDQHAGEHPFSEIETRALRDFISDGADDCKLFVALKEGTKALVYPFSTTLSPSVSAHTILQDLLCMEALEVFDEFHTGRKSLFRFGNSGRIFGPSSGYVEDWARRHLGISRSFAFYIAHHGEQDYEPVERLEEYGKASLKAIQVLATSRRIETYAESFEELINQTNLFRTSNYAKARITSWGKEWVDDNLRDKINRGAKLQMPMELINNEQESRYENLDYMSIPR